MTNLPFMFATGIENSYPTIVLPTGATKRVDEMEKAGHYQHWREDFRLVRESGMRFLRYGPPYYATHLAPGQYDWHFTDEAFAAMKEMGITPIVDLCHFGVPDWLVNFQNPDFPTHFAEYALAFAKRFPDLQLYTPVNEINICAIFSAQFGWWNERLSDEYGFVTALKHMCKANVLAMDAILSVQPAAVFIQSEGWEYFHTETDACFEKADFLNQKRFLSYDLTSGYPSSQLMQNYLLQNGMTRDEYAWFRNHPRRGNWVIGADYYAHNEHMVHTDGRTSDFFHGLGFYQVARQYYDRYRVPVMYTETNIGEEKAIPWLHQQWNELMRLKQDEIPVVGFTWYSLIDQVDWDTALREDNGNINSFGLYDIDRKIRPVGEAYRTIIAQYEAEMSGFSYIFTNNQPPKHTFV
jgi:beta-glucosidase/6-phospho-beta-glucosidase/beta-galactosidase